MREKIAGSPSRKYFALFQAGAAIIEGKALLSLHRPADAQPALQQGLTLYLELLDPVSPLTADAQIALANCWLDLHQFSPAKSLLTQANAIHAAHKELGEHFRKPLRETQTRLAKRA